LKKHVVYACAMILLAGAALAQGATLKGRVIESGSGKPIPYAYVVQGDGAAAGETDAQGYFSLELSGPGPYAIRVVTETHKARDIVYQAIPAEAVVIEIDALSVDLGVVEAVADRESLKASRSLDEKQVEQTATGGNPFALVERAPDVVDVASPALENDVYAARQELSKAMDVPVLLLANPFNYRGLPYYSNAYFMERLIPLFYQYYTFSGAMISSIVPADVLGGMDMYGNGRDPALGPGNGLLSTFSIIEPEKGEFSWTLYLSALAAGLVMEIPLFSDSAGLTFSIRKSLYDITWIPLAIELNKVYQIFPGIGVGDALELDFSIFPGNVDAYVHFWARPDSMNRVTVDLLDATGYTTLVYETLGRYNSYSNFIYSDVVHESGGGLSWECSPDPKLGLKLDAYDILSLLRKENSQTMLGGEKWGTVYSYPLNDLGGGLSAQYAPGDSLLFSMGAGGRWLKGWYERERNADPIYHMTDWSSVFRDTGLDTWEASGYAKANIDLGAFEIEPSVRLDYFPVIETADGMKRLRASPMLQLFYYPSQAHSFHLGGGMRYDRFDYFTRNSFLAEQGLRLHDGGNVTIDDSYVQKTPSRLFGVEADYSFKGKPSSLRVGAYYDYVDELSGFDYQTYTAESSDSLGGLWSEMGSTATDTAGMKTTKALWSLGGNLDYGLAIGKNSVGALYNMGVVRFLADVNVDGNYVWIAPKSDVTHVVKVFGHWEPNALWSLDGTLKALIGIPASRHKVDAAYVSDLDGTTSISFSDVKGSIYSFKDYMPRFTFDFKILFRTDSKPAVECYADIANLISFPRYARPDSDAVGFEEQSTGDRRYDWAPIHWANILSMKLDIGFRLKY
jgi:hypothetical protein